MLLVKAQILLCFVFQGTQTLYVTEWWNTTVRSPTINSVYLPTPANRDLGALRARALQDLAWWFETLRNLAVNTAAPATSTQTIKPAETSRDTPVNPTRETTLPQISRPEVNISTETIILKPIQTSEPRLDTPVNVTRENSFSQTPRADVPGCACAAPPTLEPLRKHLSFLT